MKIFKVMLVVLAITVGTYNANAQSAAKKKAQADKEAAMKQILDSQDFTFTAQQANPMRGTSINLTSSYDVRVKKDSLIAYLPYFGRAYMGVAYNQTQSPLQFTSTKFTYDSVVKKNGNREITIKFNDNKEVRQMVISTSLSGYATTTVMSNNRDPITFYGVVDSSKPDKK